jgi:hypothetical protein
MYIYTFKHIYTYTYIYRDDEEDPMEAIAGNGNSFIISLSGAVYSFGFGNYGVLGIFIKYLY